MTIREFLLKGLLNNATDRLEKLIEFSAPKIMIESQSKYIESLKNGSVKIGGDTSVLDDEYVSHEVCTGNGGKQYLHINNSINFFPNARYGLYIKKATK